MNSNVFFFLPNLLQEVSSKSWLGQNPDSTEKILFQVKQTLL